MFIFKKENKRLKMVSMWNRQTQRTACCFTVERTNTAVETLPLWLWCEASCTTGEEAVTTAGISCGGPGQVGKFNNFVPG